MALEWFQRHLACPDCQQELEWHEQGPVVCACGFAIDPAGRYLLAVGQLSHRLTSYAIEPDGALRTLKQHPVGQNPNWVEIIALPGTA